MNRFAAGLAFLATMAVTGGAVGTSARAADSTPKHFVSPLVGAMRWIPPGTFVMGSESSEPGRSSDETQHVVTLPEGFWLMDHEVTQEEWSFVMRSNPSHFKACGPTCPVEQVSWNAAVAFAKKVSAIEYLDYVLPTEEQWEYAARGGESGMFAGSNNATTVGWISDNSDETTHPICQKPRNGFGLCDMTGNVWEWTSDLYGAYPVGDMRSVAAFIGAGGAPRIHRGGVWRHDASYARVAYRGINRYEGIVYNSFGLRLARRVR